jgi:hypothetical protein
MTEKDYQRKKNKWLPKIHAWYTVSLFLSEIADKCLHSLTYMLIVMLLAVFWGTQEIMQFKQVLVMLVLVL